MPYARHPVRLILEALGLRRSVVFLHDGDAQARLAQSGRDDPASQPAIGEEMG
jgi:hypothetical protein